MEKRYGRGDPDFVPKWMEEGVKESWSSKPKCGAETRQASPNGPKGHPCQRPSGWGTDHPGFGACKLHGGSLPGQKVAAAREEATKEAMRVMGPAIEVEPMEALLWCVRISAGEVAYTTFKVESLEENDAYGQVETESVHRATGGEKMEAWEETAKGPPELHIWIRARHIALDRLAKYSKMALDAGVAERQVQMAEEAGDELALAIREILDGLKLTIDQEKKAPAVVRSALVKLEMAKELTA